MAELALGEPSGLVPDLAGPKNYALAEAGQIRAWTTARSAASAI
jgi:hypothetical protein